jgi:hypothetical protein
MGYNILSTLLEMSSFARDKAETEAPPSFFTASIN